MLKKYQEAVHLKVAKVIYSKCTISVLGLLSQWEEMRGTYKELQHQSWTD